MQTTSLETWTVSFIDNNARERVFPHRSASPRSLSGVGVGEGTRSEQWVEMGQLAFRVHVPGTRHLGP